ncbi:unnamed protein product [Rotaria socialis]|uniref:Uncharacterized protein n=2 Tax=Rotaria socialis TaxID=392032 RepID=A0A817VP78_9BILA|nr:unnamed protein product [Rotaria socialis]
MIIIGYSGDVYSIIRTFLGLNQRLNCILLDKRLHLLTDFLYIKIADEIFESYHNSLQFQHVTQKLVTNNGLQNENQTIECLRVLVMFNIKSKYISAGNNFQLYGDRLQILRQNLTHNELQQVDHDLAMALDPLKPSSKTIKQICSLIYERGARLEYMSDQLNMFDLARLINNQMFLCYQSDPKKCHRYFYHLISMFKGMIFSNPHLLNNCSFMSYGYDVIHFLLCTIFQRRFIYKHQSSTSNLYYYQSFVDLFLLSIQCRRSITIGKNWAETYFFEILYRITAEKDRIDNHSDIFIQTTEIELLNILQDEYYLQISIPWNENSKDLFTRALNRFFRMNYIDLILLIYRHNELLRTFFNTTDYIERNIGIMIGNRMRKQLLNTLIDEKPLALCFINRNFLFRLLDKKQFQILKKTIELSKSVLNLIDDDGNDLLLYLCLKVRGCRHRFIQYLIGIRSNTQRINYHGQSLIDILKLKNNRSLLKKLIEHEIIENVV